MKPPLRLAAALLLALRLVSCATHGAGHKRSLRLAAAVSRHTSDSGVCGIDTQDGLPSPDGTPAEWCPFCRWCCSCNANDSMDCEASTVDPSKYGAHPHSGAVVFCSTCERSCSSCSQYD